jgi:hypothetical protein
MGVSVESRTDSVVLKLLLLLLFKRFGHHLVVLSLGLLHISLVFFVHGRIVSCLFLGPFVFCLLFIFLLGAFILLSAPLIGVSHLLSVMRFARFSTAAPHALSIAFAAVSAITATVSRELFHANLVELV